MLTKIQFDQFILAWLVLALGVFILLMFVNAPYGRHIKSGWGINIPAKLGWIAMESPTIIIMTVYFYYHSFVVNSISLTATLFYAMWMFHYIHRTLVWPFRAQINKKKMPISIALFAIFFNSINTGINAQAIFEIYSPYPENWVTSPKFICGIFLFLVGMWINISSDNTLIKIRRQSHNEYVIPQGKLYKWVSSPNYLGEIIEWIGWAIAIWSLAGFSFAFWVIANLLPRAKSNHLWYLENFKDYPKERRKLIPGIW